MRVLSFDPGAKRAGWAALETGPVYLDSALVEYPREGNEPYQAYRMRLIYFWRNLTEGLVEAFEPDLIVTETVPVYGMNDFSQGYLALVMSVAVQTMGIHFDVEVKQISARTVQKHIAIKGKSKGVTKTQVRNGVITLLPELEELYGKTKIFEPTDALAIGLFTLGYRT